MGNCGWLFFNDRCLFAEVTFFCTHSRSRSVLVCLCIPFHSHSFRCVPLVSFRIANAVLALQFLCKHMAFNTHLNNNRNTHECGNQKMELCELLTSCCHSVCIDMCVLDIGMNILFFCICQLMISVNPSVFQVFKYLFDCWPFNIQIF